MLITSVRTYLSRGPCLRPVILLTLFNVFYITESKYEEHQASKTIDLVIKAYKSS